MNWQDLNMRNIPPVDAFLDSTDNEVFLDFYRAMRYEIIRCHETLDGVRDAMNDLNKALKGKTNG